ncbi:acyl-[acyl-carrier-protein] thioesterase [Williamwhitmania taraxaci]|uniref:Acyl-ACP thioesterase n=1 Tax=Williamwhitmania taraxaci TaxID=1640674 RepID=A0A1G6LHE9_9BACT|nr:acyl-ACP thioesterase domain-containing protein [Williamwhitmania taraxaci]SDC42680.1 Acyl-ACP thioesterase [Williamwhitmania taraxaci]
MESNHLKNQDTTLRLPYPITSADTDMNARLKLSSLTNFLVQAAITSADSLGFGFGGLRQQKLFWVLSRLTIEIERPLTWYQSCEVETWPKDLDKILYLRDYLIRNQEQQLVAKATSGWLAIDLKTKRPKTFEGDISIFNQLKDKHALSILPEKLFPVKGGNAVEIKPTFFDFDLNGHVTATRYIDWMMDTFPIDFHKNNYPKKLSINFLKEIMPGEAIQLTHSNSDEKSFSFEGFNTTANTFAFRGLIEF